MASNDEHDVTHPANKRAKDREKKQQEKKPEYRHHRSTGDDFWHTAKKPFQTAYGQFQSNGQQFHTLKDSATAISSDIASNIDPHHTSNYIGGRDWGKSNGWQRLRAVCTAPARAVNTLCNGVGMVANATCKFVGDTVIKGIGKGFGAIAGGIEYLGKCAGGKIGANIASVVSAPFRVAETACNIAGNVVSAVGDIAQDACRLVGAVAHVVLTAGLSTNAWSNLVSSTSNMISSPLTAVSNILADTSLDIVQQGQRMVDNGANAVGSLVQSVGHGVGVGGSITSAVATGVRQLTQGHLEAAARGFGAHIKEATHHLVMTGSSAVGFTNEENMASKLGYGDNMGKGQVRAELLKKGISLKEIEHIDHQLDQKGSINDAGQTRAERFEDVMKSADGNTRKAVNKLRSIASSPIDETPGSERMSQASSTPSNGTGYKPPIPASR